MSKADTVKKKKTTTISGRCSEDFKGHVTKALAKLGLDESDFVRQCSEALRRQVSRKESLVLPLRFRTADDMAFRGRNHASRTQH